MTQGRGRGRVRGMQLGLVDLRFGNVVPSGREWAGGPSLCAPQTKWRAG